VGLLETIHANTVLILRNQVKQMTVLADIQAADMAIKTAVAAAVTLIQNLHSGASSVSDAEVEAVVADLQGAASALSAAAPQP
jgi:hypothetical protein